MTATRPPNRPGDSPRKRLLTTTRPITASDAEATRPQNVRRSDRRNRRNSARSSSGRPPPESTDNSPTCRSALPTLTSRTPAVIGTADRTRPPPIKLAASAGSRITAITARNQNNPDTPRSSQPVRWAIRRRLRAMDRAYGVDPWWRRGLPASLSGLGQPGSPWGLVDLGLRASHRRPEPAGWLGPVSHPLRTSLRRLAPSAPSTGDLFPTAAR